ncbi:Transcription Initiation Factor Tfiid Subunit 1 [Manis pentadactyla]|nr:Transcription Initiation Factor Tfiid Subunit 1 [Manis pentadactyla]
MPAGFQVPWGLESKILLRCHGICRLDLAFSASDVGSDSVDAPRGEKMKPGSSNTVRPMNTSCGFRFVCDGPTWIKEFPLNPGFSLLLSFDVNRTPGTGPTLMDPNRLSMEQGKLFFKQLGIPQRDIDLMTEEWVVVTPVEVMLQFPLMPGENPAACCV